MDKRVLVDYVHVKVSTVIPFCSFSVAQERGRSRLASCGNRSGEGTHGTGIRGPDVVIPGCSLWGQFLHSQRDLKRRNDLRISTSYEHLIDL